MISSGASVIHLPTACSVLLDGAQAQSTSATWHSPQVHRGIEAADFLAGLRLFTTITQRHDHLSRPEYAVIPQQWTCRLLNHDGNAQEGERTPRWRAGLMYAVQSVEVNACFHRKAVNISRKGAFFPTRKREVVCLQHCALARCAISNLAVHAPCRRCARIFRAMKLLFYRLPRRP